MKLFSRNESSETGAENAVLLVVLHCKLLLPDSVSLKNIKEQFLLTRDVFTSVSVRGKQQKYSVPFVASGRVLSLSSRDL